MQKLSLIATNRSQPTLGSAAVGFVSLGCAKALVDSERILTSLRQENYALVDNHADADLVIVNTCGFIDSAREESLASIHQAVRSGSKVIVTGCLGANKEELMQRFPRLVGVTGPADATAVMALVHQHLPQPVQPNTRFLDLIPSGVKLTPRHYAYVKIAEGCNHSCSFCIIPQMRGTLVSRPLDEVMSECEQLVHDGVRELLIVAQDTGAYGLDLRYQPTQWRNRDVATNLEDLVTCLASLGVWVRLHYLYPYPQLSRIIPLMRDGGILPYLDMPLQHGDPEVLKRMRRPHASERVLERLNQWREQCPDLRIRSTFIVGFPGETETQFEQLLDFLRAAQLDRVGAFMYSPVSGARANDLDGHIPVVEQERRLAAFMQIQADISKAKLQAAVGSYQEVMVDDHDSAHNRLVCRSRGDAPEVDGLVYVRYPSRSQLLPQVGERIKVRIEHADDHDLYAALTERAH